MRRDEREIPGNIGFRYGKIPDPSREDSLSRGESEIFGQISQEFSGAIGGLYEILTIHGIVTSETD